MKLTRDERALYLFNSRVLWALSVLPLAIAIWAIPLSDVSYELDQASRNAALGIPLAAASLVYTYLRRDDFVLFVTETLALVLLCPSLTGLVVLITTSLGSAIPFRDSTFQHLDTMLQFDWLALLAWMNSHTTVAAAVAVGYDSIHAQGAFIIAYGLLTRAHARLQTFLTAAQVSLLVSCVAAMLVPTLGPYWLLGITPETHHPNITLTTMNIHVPHVLALRETGALIRQSDPIGLITFPSMHAAAAVHYTWFFWSKRILRWPALVLNGLMLAGTPSWGSHYLVDVIAGLAVGAGSVLGACFLRRRWCAKLRSSETPPTGGPLAA